MLVAILYDNKLYKKYVINIIKNEKINILLIYLY